MVHLHYEDLPQGTVMELCHSLTLNEEALQQIPEPKRPVFIFEWLRFLDQVLVAAQKNDIKGCQAKLVDQLTGLIYQNPGPPTRRLIASCLATLFSVGDTFLLFDTVNKCNDVLKNKDDSPSFLPTKLAAICCVGNMYEKLGRMMGRSYEETVQILIKSLRNAESQMRIAIMTTLEKVCCGMGSALVNMHKEIYKAARSCLTDRVMAVRCAAARCLVEMTNHASFLYTSELEGLAGVCFRAFDGSNYEVRCSVARLLGVLVANTQLYPPSQKPTPSGNQSSTSSKATAKSVSLEEALGVLMSGFLRGGTGFLKGTGEIIKGSSGVNREIRVGVTHAYVIFVQTMGSAWLERNLNPVLSHVLDLVANPKAASSHVDAVYSRKCVNFILRSSLGRMLTEKAQSSACKEIAAIINAQIKSIDPTLENTKDCNQETLFGQHLMVCALQEVAHLVLALGTTATHLISDTTNNLLDCVVAVLVHPCQAARLAAAWCLRCICVAVPSQITPLIDKCVEAIETLRSSPEAIAGYSAALAAVLGGVRLSPLGLPHTKGKIIFNTAEELLRSANQNSRLSLNRTQAGWLLIGAIMTLGVPVVRGLLPRMLLLWRNSFPRSNKELESEKARGDAFTWQVTLEGRAGALSAMHSFLENCPELINDDITRRLLTPVESALGMLVNIQSVLKSYGQHLKAPAAMVRLRLYKTLSLLPPQSFEGSYTHLLRLLVSEFTLSENPANTSTSQLHIACHADDSIILGSWLQETDHKTIEDQLQTNSAAGSGALEHDTCCLYRPLPAEESIPGPLPLGVAVIDASVVLFGLVFPRVNTKHRVQMLDHFAECLRSAKSFRADALTLNVFTALLTGLRGLSETKATLGGDEVKNSAVTLISGVVTNNSGMLRCAAAEALGRVAQAVGEPRFTAELAQASFDKLRSARDVASRTGHSLVLGCLHRYVGGLGSAQHLNTSVSILLALAQDSTSPVVQVWSLHALSLIASSGGPMFRGYVEPTLSLCLKLLLNIPQSHVDVHQCIGKVLNALITTVGPELQGNTSSVFMTRSSFLCACAIMQDHMDPLVQAEATSCLQQLHLFAPRHVNLSSLVPTLCRTLSSSHLLLRKAAVACLRQLTQREAKEVCEHALTLANESRDRENNTVEGLVITETGLPGVLFTMLDTETDRSLIQHIHDTLTSMLQMLAADNLSQWLCLSKGVLTVANERVSGEEGGGDNSEDEGDDVTEFHAGRAAEEDARNTQPRWPTRVFAAESLRRIITACRIANKPQHFDLALAKEMQQTSNTGDYLVLHLSELVRMAFMAATSDCDPLRLEGLSTLSDIIENFCGISEPEFPGHLLLEQYQAQVGAALRPAFAGETPAHVTAAACQVCSAWISSGVARDLNDLRRVHNLLVSSLTKLQRSSATPLIYNESLLTLERLAILTAWAEVYIVAMTGDKSKTNCDEKKGTGITEDDEFGDFESHGGGGESLLSLVHGELENLSQNWLAALKDHALLSLPPEFSSQLPHDGGAFYTMDTMDSCRPHYAKTWPSLLYATALWLKASSEPPDQDKFHLLFGICMEALCSPRTPEPIESVITCLKALYTLLDAKFACQALMADRSLGIELCNVLHRILLTRDSPQAHELAIDVLKQVVKAALDDLEEIKQKQPKETTPGNEDTDSAVDSSLDMLGEGGDEGELVPGKSVVFASLEVCLCLIAGQVPRLNPSPSSPHLPTPPQPSGPLLANTLHVMSSLTSLCSPQGALAVLPTLLYLTTGVLRECSDINTAVSGALKALKSLCQDNYSRDERVADHWAALLQSALAKIIDLAKTGTDEEETKLDEVTVMLSITVFVLHAPPVVLSAPNLQYPCINHFRQCLQSNHIELKVKCVQSLKTIFSNGDRTVCTGYIHALAPRLMDYLHTRDAKQLGSDMELTLTLETISALHALVLLTEPKHRLDMLKLLVPELIECLLEGPALKEANRYCRTLHDTALQWLMKIGPQFPQELKELMLESSDMRSRLESAVRSDQELRAKQSALKHSSNPQPTIHQPTIKLKTHFNHFTS